MPNIELSKKNKKKIIALSFTICIKKKGDWLVYTHTRSGGTGVACVRGGGNLTLKLLVIE